MSLSEFHNQSDSVFLIYTQTHTYTHERDIFAQTDRQMRHRENDKAQQEVVERQRRMGETKRKRDR